jgi:hypothetical protein
MNRSMIRSFSQLEYRDPRPFLVKLREFELMVARTETPKKIRTLRTNALKGMRELREAAMFSFLMGQRIGQTVYCAPLESQDYDFVALWDDGGVPTYAPVQLKELVPDDLNPAVTLAHLINALKKYVDSRELTVAIHLNRQDTFDFRNVQLPELNVGSLWFFGAVSPDQSIWGLWGDFMKNPSYEKYSYPLS